MKPPRSRRGRRAELVAGKRRGQAEEPGLEDRLGGVGAGVEVPPAEYLDGAALGVALGTSVLNEQR